MDHKITQCLNKAFKKAIRKIFKAFKECPNKETNGGISI